MQHIISERLLRWHEGIERKLPWKETKDPYKIWISEIVLQQTRVQQGMSYYLKLIERYPRVLDLATSTEDELMRHWKGLGYYSRARNLHKTAKIIVEKYDETFPKSYKEIRSLPGVGPYTAAAISSFAFDLPHAVVDGNVYRVLSRLFSIFTPINTGAGQKEFQQLAQELLPTAAAAAYNQAIMDFGALTCTPSKPQCATCPLDDICKANEQQLQSQLPIKEKKLKRKNRNFISFLLQEKDGFYIRKRTQKDIWNGLYELPMAETTSIAKESRLPKPLLTNMVPAGVIEKIDFLCSKKQRLTHQDIKIDFYKVTMSLLKEIAGYKKIKDSSEYAFPRIIDEFLIEYLSKHEKI